MQKKHYEKRSLLDSLAQILEKTQQTEQVKVREILMTLATRGTAALLIVFSLPFCFPLQIPGVSTPFGIFLGFLGLQIAFGKRPWFPQWILERTVKSSSLAMLVEKTMKTLQWMQKILHPRLMILTQHSFFLRLNGLLVVLLAFLLSLPLPIPFTNMLSAFPILFIGLGLLESDGLFILLGYFLAAFDLAFFYSLFLWSFLQIKQLLV